MSTTRPGAPAPATADPLLPPRVVAVLRSPVLRVVVVLVLLGELAVYLLGVPGQLSWDLLHLDLQVYRLGGQSWRDDGDLYGDSLVTSIGLGLPFTYPPLAAVLFASFSLVPLPLAGLLLSLATAGLLALVLWLFLPVELRQGRDGAWLLATVLAAAVLLEPVRATLDYGQVNVLLMALVAADLLVTNPRWRRGTLIGLAAAIKLTPAAFVLLPLLRRDGRTVLTSFLAFLGFSALGVLLAPSESRQYWLDTLLDPSRPGPAYFAGNQSLRASLARLGVEGTAQTAGWLALCLLTLALTSVGVLRAVAAGRQSLAVVLTALGALLVSPVSWSHHWVWAGPAIVVLGLVARENRSRWAAGLALSGTVVFYVGLQFQFGSGDDVELTWSWWKQLLVGSYVEWALVVLAVAAVNPGRWLRARESAAVPA